MANSKEIKTQIASISNTQKITSAMEKVAVSKMKKTRDRWFTTNKRVSQFISSEDQL